MLPPTAIYQATYMIGNDFSMKARILQFMEQTSLYNCINFSLGFRDFTNSTVANAVMSFWLCPSDVDVPRIDKGNTNYPNSVGIMRIGGTMTDGPAYKMGLPTPDSPPVSFALITDGLSNTVIFSEWIKGTALANNAAPKGKNLCWTAPGSEPTVNNAQPYSTATFAQAALNCQNTNTIQDDMKGQQWMNQQTGRGGAYSHTNTPNKKGCVYAGDGGIVTNDDHTAISASSNHPGGVNVLFLDGSVKFVKDSVNQMTWWAIATRAGGEVVSADAF